MQLSYPKANIYFKFNFLLWSLLVSVILLFFLASCDNGGGSSSTLVPTNDGYTVVAGETVTFTDDLAIHVTGDVVIGGALIAMGANGQDVTITSDSGNITITDTGSITAGEGIDGVTITTVTASVLALDDDGYPFNDRRKIQFKSIQGGGGTNGGSITLQAPNGTITIPDVDGVIHVGNGGNGADISVQGQDLLTTEIPDEFTNHGGDGGRFDITAKNIAGLDYTTDILSEDGIDPMTGESIPAGSTIYNINDTRPFSGGRGGDGGGVSYGMDSDGNSTWPEADTINSIKSFSEEEGIINVSGAEGGNGWLGNPGRGGRAYFAGKPGGRGEDGQEVNLNGGNAGNCVGVLFVAKCNPAKGGNAWAWGGQGGKGFDPIGQGGNGGLGRAVGGLGSRERVRSIITTEYIKGSPSGDAYALGGNGGEGGGTCPDNVAPTGGRGGKGGQAHAMGYYSTIRAQGGNGGSGGHYILWSGGSLGGNYGEIKISPVEDGVRDTVSPPYAAEGSWEKPGSDGGKGEQCLTPDPNTPDPNTPDPNTPDPNTPDPNTPDPNTPDPNTPDPNTPDPNTPDPNTPVDPSLIKWILKFILNGSDGKTTTGNITLYENGTFKAHGTGGNAGSFDGEGIFEWLEEIINKETKAAEDINGELTITYTSYVLNGATITPGAGDTWATLSGTLVNGSGTLTDVYELWSIDLFY